MSANSQQRTFDDPLGTAQIISFDPYRSLETPIRSAPRVRAAQPRGADRIGRCDRNRGRTVGRSRLGKRCLWNAASPGRSRGGRAHRSCSRTCSQLTDAALRRSRGRNSFPASATTPIRTVVTERLIGKSELARYLGVSPSAVTHACRGMLKPALRSGRILVDGR